MDLSALMAALENVILTRQTDGRFVRCGDLPAWARALTSDELASRTPFALGEVFPFLEAFIAQAEQAWRDESGGPASSDMWTQVGPSGEEIHLQASALRVQAAEVLIIARSDRLFKQHQLVLQRARELRLTHDAFMREIERKDILIHAIVHDLAAPLHSILGTLSLLGEQPLGEPSAQWVRMSLQAALRQRQLITDILDIFSSERGEPSLESSGTAPDACKIIANVVAESTPAGERHATRIESRTEDAPCLVAAEETRLFRVLTNLVDNALRYSPRGGTIRVAARREGRKVRISVEDEGPGVPPEVMPRLFEKFSRGRTGSGTGLGLYFCRITIERWGGEIGYEPREEGGARFWLRLPLANGSGADG
jgi:signal transduction histidine kinase